MSASVPTRVAAALRAWGVDVHHHLQRRYFSDCYLATSADGGQELFLKLLRARGPRIRAHFEREIETLLALRGREGMPELVAASACAAPRFHACLFIRAPTLSASIQAGEEVSLDHVLILFARLADWICRLHALGYAHRDLSPDHVFLGDSLVVVDFGMAKPVGRSRAADLARSYDVQAAGMMIWELICGRRLFDYRGPALSMQLLRETELVQAALPSPELANIIARCLGLVSDASAGIAGTRPIDAASLSDALASIAAHLPWNAHANGGAT